MVCLKHAKDMLTSPDLHTLLTGVAFACDFANLRHFAKEFHEAFGKRPPDTLARTKRGKTLLEDDLCASASPWRGFIRSLECKRDHHCVGIGPYCRGCLRRYLTIEGDALVRTRART
jgi:AraC-like DNA-binding protein